MAGTQQRAPALLLCFSMALSAAQGQIRYSIPEELEKGAFVGNIVKGLGLKTAELSERSLRLVSKGKTQHFAFSSANGHLYVNEQIDREKLCAQTSPCLLVAEMIAQNPLALYQFEVEIQDINDNAPRFPENELVLEMSEGSAPGKRFLLPRATDSDVGENSIQTYSLQHSVYFKTDIIIATGNPKTPQLVLEKALDREDVPVHHLILIASDGGDPVRSGTMHIRVVVLDSNDNAPVFSQSVYTVRVKEDVPEGALITKVTATDADEGSNGKFTFSIGSAFVSHRSKLEVTPKTGEIYLRGKLDFEVAEQIEIQILVKDNGDLADESKLVIEVIDINDNPPKVTLTSITSPVSEDCAPGTVIAIFNVRDDDSKENGQVTCSISDDLPFQLKSSFGDYYTIVTDRRLDREQAFEYNITITAEDHGKPALISRQIIRLQISDMNDNAPVFSSPSYTAYLMENNPRAASIFAVKATDLDVSQNARISYSLMNTFKQEELLSSYVSINSETGVIYGLCSFDFEQLKDLKFQIKAQDGGSPSLSSNTTVNIIVLDQNDNTPEILHPSTPTDGSSGVEMAPHSSEPGYLITKVVAVDADSGPNAWLSYQLLRSTDQGLFSVGLHTGEIRTARTFVEKDALRQILLVLVKDNGHPPLSASVTVTVLLADSIPEIISDKGSFQPSVDVESNLTLYLVIAVAFVSCLFLIFLIVLLAARLLRWKQSRDFVAKTLNAGGLPASMFVGVDGVHTFLRAYPHDMTLRSDSGHRNTHTSHTLTPGTQMNNITPGTQINNFAPNNWDLIVVQNGNIDKEAATNELSNTERTISEIIPSGYILVAGVACLILGLFPFTF